MAARINSEIQPLRSELKNGDVVEVVTGPVAPPEPPATEAPSPAPPLGELPPAVDREIAAIADGETREAVRRSARVSLATPRPAGPPTRRGADP